MIHHGDCLEVMARMTPESIDSIVTDPPYGIGFMGKAWDALSADAVEASWNARGRNTVSTRDPDADTPAGRSATRTGFADPNPRCGNCGRAINGRDTPKGFKVCHCENPTYAPTPNRSAQRSQAWHQQWAEAAYRVAKPSAYLLAFGGTRTVHRMTVALEDAGWIIRDMLVWAYASGFPKSKANLKPAWEPIVMARKPGPLRDLAIDACRIGFVDDADRDSWRVGGKATSLVGSLAGRTQAWTAVTTKAISTTSETPDAPPAIASAESLPQRTEFQQKETSGRWPANVLLTDPIFDGGVEGVVGGGEARSTDATLYGAAEGRYQKDTPFGPAGFATSYGDSGTYSRFFLVPKSSRSDREPAIPPEWFEDGKRANSHPTCKPTELMRHLVRLVTPAGGTVLDPFLGSGTTGLACELEGFPWIGIEKEAEYVAIAEARLNGTQRGLGLAG